MNNKYYNTVEFKKLQKKWYAKLKTSGFVDAETINYSTSPDGILSQQSSNAYKQIESTLVKIKEEYFSLVNECVEKEEWNNPTYEFVLRSHANGKSHLSIVREFTKINGKTINRKMVRYIICSYLTYWGIKYYSSNQLNLMIKNKKSVKK